MVDDISPATRRALRSHHRAWKHGRRLFSTEDDMRAALARLERAYFPPLAYNRTTRAALREIGFHVEEFSCAIACALISEIQESKFTTVEEMGEDALSADGALDWVEEQREIIGNGRPVAFLICAERRMIVLVENDITSMTKPEKWYDLAMVVDDEGWSAAVIIIDGSGRATWWWDDMELFYLTLPVARDQVVFQQRKISDILGERPPPCRLVKDSPT